VRASAPSGPNAGSHRVREQQLQISSPVPRGCRGKSNAIGSANARSWWRSVNSGICTAVDGELRAGSTIADAGGSGRQSPVKPTGDNPLETPRQACRSRTRCLASAASQIRRTDRPMSLSFAQASGFNCAHRGTRVQDTSGRARASPLRRRGRSAPSSRPR
jgi:hypothetical protein